MVETARRRAGQLGLEEGPELTFAVEDAAALSLGDASIDGVLCRWGLMFPPVMERATAEIARVLRPGGRRGRGLGRAGAQRLDHGRGSQRGRARPARASRPERPGPFRLSAPGAVESVLRGGGLEVEVVEDLPLTWRAASLDEWWETVVDTSRMLPDVLAPVGPDDAAEIRDGAERRLADHVGADGVARGAEPRAGGARRPPLSARTAAHEDGEGRT